MKVSLAFPGDLLVHVSGLDAVPCDPKLFMWLAYASADESHLPTALGRSSRTRAGEVEFARVTGQYQGNFAALARVHA